MWVSVSSFEANAYDRRDTDGLLVLDLPREDEPKTREDRPSGTHVARTSNPTALTGIDVLRRSSEAE